MFYLVCRKSFLTYFGKTFICYWANLNLFYTLWKFGCKITIVCWQDFSCPFYLHQRTDPVDSSPFILQLLTHTCNCLGHTQSHANTYLCLSLSLSLSCFFLFLYLSLWHSRSLLICCFPKMFQLTRALNEWTSGWLRYFVQILLRW